VFKTIGPTQINARATIKMSLLTAVPAAALRDSFATFAACCCYLSFSLYFIRLIWAYAPLIEISPCAYLRRNTMWK